MLRFEGFFLKNVRSISQNYYNTLPPLHISLVEHDNIMNKKPEDKGLNLRYQYQ